MNVTCKSVVTLLFMALTLPSPTKVAAQVASENGLAQQAADPTAPLMAFNFKTEYVTNFYGLSGSGSDFLFQPVIPFRVWKQNNLLRVTVNYNITGPEEQGPDDTDLGGEETPKSNAGQQGIANVAVFDLIVFNRSWGRWGFGPLVQFLPNTGGKQDSAMAGPAIGFVARKGVWNLGLFSQNLFGNNTRFSSVQPVIAYGLGHGATLAAGDAQWSIDWTKPQFVNIPLGIQLSQVMKLGGQPVKLSVNPEYNARSVTGSPHWTIRFAFTILAPAGPAKPKGA